MDGVTVSVLGALAALVVAIVLILKKVQPTYAMLIGAVAGGLIGGAALKAEDFHSVCAAARVD